MEQTELKRVLETLTPSERRSLLTSCLRQAAKNNPKIWLWGAKGAPGLVYTLDPHDREPIKLFPKKMYLLNLVEAWMPTGSKLLVEKSRQMMVTWLFVALYLWDTLYRPGRHNFFQSKKEDDAAELLNRAKHIWTRLPDKPKCEWKNTIMNVTGTSSRLQAIPQGGDIIRMHTASGIFADEMAFQEQAEDAFTAARPTFLGGGRFTGVSTPNFRNFWYRMVYDKM